MTIIRLVRANSLFDTLRPQLKSLDSWITQWDLDEEEARQLYSQIADVAEDAGEEEYVRQALWMIVFTDHATENPTSISLRHLGLSIKRPKSSPRTKKP